MSEYAVEPYSDLSFYVIGKYYNVNLVDTPKNINILASMHNIIRFAPPCWGQKIIINRIQYMNILYNNHREMLKLWRDKYIFNIERETHFFDDLVDNLYMIKDDKLDLSNYYNKIEELVKLFIKEVKVGLTVKDIDKKLTEEREEAVKQIVEYYKKRNKKIPSYYEERMFDHPITITTIVETYKRQTDKRKVYEYYYDCKELMDRFISKRNDGLLKNITPYTFYELMNISINKDIIDGRKYSLNYDWSISDLGF